MFAYKPRKYMIQNPKIKVNSFNDWNINLQKMHTNIKNFILYLPTQFHDYTTNCNRLHGIIYEALKDFCKEHKWSWSTANDIVHNLITENIWVEKHFTPANKVYILNYIHAYLSNDFLLHYIA